MADLSFLDQIGGNNISRSENLANYKSLPEVERLLAEYGGKVFFANATKYINQEGLIYKGKLSTLLSFDIVNEGGTKYTLSVGYPKGEADYWQFVNYGVKGTRRGMSEKGYSFKNAYPSKKMVSAFEEYVRFSGFKNRDSKKKFLKQETKEINTSKNDAYLLAKIVKMYGIKPRLFMQKAAKDTFNQDFSSKIALAVGKDLKIFIKQS